MAAVPATRTWVAGEVVTAAFMNNTIRDVDNWLLASAIVQLYQAGTAQVIPNNTWTAVTFDTEYVDSTGMHSTVTNTSRITAVYPGWYDAFGLGSFASNATGARGVRIQVNGTAINGSATSKLAVASINTDSTAAYVYLNVGDYIEIAVFQSSGGNLNAGPAAQSPSAKVGWKSN